MDEKSDQKLVKNYQNEWKESKWGPIDLKLSQFHSSPFTIGISMFETDSFDANKPENGLRPKSLEL